jgi:hypothetical protein
MSENENALRLTKEIQIAGKTVMVSELTVREIKQFWKELSELSLAEGFSLSPGMIKLWDVTIQGLDVSEIDDYTPSILKKVYDTFREVNATFFDLANQFENGDPVLIEIRKVITMALISQFAAFSNEVTQESSTTDTASS